MDGTDNLSAEIESTVVDLEDWMYISNDNYDIELLESTVFDSTLDVNSEKVIRKLSSISPGSNQYGIDWKKAFPDLPIICPFVWNQGGEEVYLVGKFNDEARKYKMYKTGNKFYVILDIQRGIYPYRFIIDGNNRYSADHPNFTIKNGLVVNILDIRYYVPMDYSVYNDRQWANDLTYSQKLPKEMYFSLHPPPIPEIFNYSAIGEDVACISNDIHIYGNNLCHDNKATELLGRRYKCYGIIMRDKHESQDGVDQRQLYTEYLYVTLSKKNNDDEIEDDVYVSRWKEMMVKARDSQS